MATISPPPAQPSSRWFAGTLSCKGWWVITSDDTRGSEQTIWPLGLRLKAPRWQTKRTKSILVSLTPHLSLPLLPPLMLLMKTLDLMKMTPPPAPGSKK